MKPLILESTTTTFPPTNEELGRLSDCTSCLVSETINNDYTLVAETHIEGTHSALLAEGRYLWVSHDATGDKQPFEIKQIKIKNNGMMTVYAEHLSYKMQRITVAPFEMGSLALTVAAIPTKSYTANPFTFSADFSSSVTYKLNKPTTARNVLFGEKGSIIDVYGQGEWIFDKYTATIVQARGTDKSSTARIRRGHNLTDMSITSMSTSGYNAVVPFYYDSYNGELVQAGSSSDPSSRIISDGEPYTDALPLDLTLEFSSVPTAADVASKAATWISANKPQNSEPTYTIKFDPVIDDSMSGVVLGDTVTVNNPYLHVNNRPMRVVKTVWDVLREQYNNIEVGTVSKSLYDLITKKGR